MKALILNSGMGSRMGELTSKHPKCMTKLKNDETIISRQLRLLASAGISEVVMTTGLFDDVLQSYCRELSLPIKISFVKNSLYAETNYIYSIYCARKLLKEDIILLHGDLVFESKVLELALGYKESCMVVSSTVPLPEKDFKAVLEQGQISKIGIDCFENAVAAQPLYKLVKKDWMEWLQRIESFCESGEIKCYAENAFNEVSNKCVIYPLDVKALLCAEIDTPEDLKAISERV